jgi:hypothetical protein
MSPRDKYASITCPIQRAVARRVGRILDLFTDQFVHMDAEARLSAFVQAKNESERWRNLVRIPALGFVQRLGRDLGLSVVDLHGEGPATADLRAQREAYQAKHPKSRRYTKLRAPGSTQIAELRLVQRTTAISACAMFDAVLKDGGALPLVLRAHYESILAEAKEEVSVTGPEVYRHIGDMVVGGVHVPTRDQLRKRRKVA